MAQDRHRAAESPVTVPDHHDHSYWQTLSGLAALAWAQSQLQPPGGSRARAW